MHIIVATALTAELCEVACLQVSAFGHHVTALRLRLHRATRHPTSQLASSGECTSL